MWFSDDASWIHKCLFEVTEDIKLNSRGLRFISESHTGHITHHLLTGMTNWCPSTSEVLDLFRILLSDASTVKLNVAYKTFCAEHYLSVCVTVTCAFVWNTVAFEVSPALLTGFIRFRHALLGTLPPLLLFSGSLLIFTLLFIFMLF